MTMLIQMSLSLLYSHAHAPSTKQTLYFNFAPLTHQVEAAEASFAEASASAHVAKLAAMPVVKTFANVSAPDASERVGQLQGGFVKGQVRLRLCVFVCV